MSSFTQLRWCRDVLCERHGDWFDHSSPWPAIAARLKQQALQLVHSAPWLQRWLPRIAQLAGAAPISATFVHAVLMFASWRITPSARGQSGAEPTEVRDNMQEIAEDDLSRPIVSKGDSAMTCYRFAKLLPYAIKPGIETDKLHAKAGSGPLSNLQNGHSRG
jgi:hypothetical protein